MTKMERKHFLAAEVYGYSYENYYAHLEIDNLRFTRLMPADVEVLRQATEENWDDARLAKVLAVDEDKAEFWRQLYRDALEIVDAETRVKAFRAALHVSIRNALDEGLSDEDSIERLVTQVCYRVADLSYLLRQEGRPLYEYSEQLREETDADHAWLVSRFGDVSDEN